MNAPNSGRWGSLLREFIVIFAGVLIALVADDWRTSREEQRRSVQSLRVVTEDLRSDSGQLVGLGQLASGHNAAARWLFENWDVPQPPPDSIEWALMTLSGAQAPTFSRAGWDGLRNSNRLHLISSDSLRNALSAYYEVHQSDLLNYWSLIYARREALMRTFSSQVVYNTYGFQDQSLYLRNSWGGFTADPMLQTEIRRYGLSMAVLQSVAQNEARQATLLLDAVTRAIDGR